MKERKQLEECTVKMNQTHVFLISQIVSPPLSAGGEHYLGVPRSVLSDVVR